MSDEQIGRLEITESLSLELSADLSELRLRLHPPPDALSPDRARTLARWLTDAAAVLESAPRRPRRPEPDDAGGGGGGGTFPGGFEKPPVPEF
jgi:hypothetical protein